jgi:hypothetical protein
MTKTEKEAFSVQLDKLMAQYAVTGKSFQEGPAFAQAIQAVAVKEAIFLLCRIMLSM